MPLRKRATTIQDVARAARVSAATVSRVLSMPEKVAEGTRERVFEAVRETGYTINEAARSLRMRSARTIVAALPHIGNPFYSTIIESVLGAAHARGYAVLVAARLDADPNRWFRDYLMSNRADGLIIFDGSLNTRLLHDIARDAAALPLVAAYDEVPDPQVNSVITDNRAAARRAVEHLISLGHRRIGHIQGPSRNDAPNERLVGYQEAMRAAGLELENDLLVSGNFTLPSGVAAAEELLARYRLPTAVFAANDEMAIGFIARLREAGIECPRDISVVGFDDINVSPYMSPPLTTIQQPREAIGRIATDAVIDIIENLASDAGPLHIVLESELVIRGSTAPPPR